MQYLKNDMNKILFQVLGFQLAQEATFRGSQLALSKMNLCVCVCVCVGGGGGASRHLLISNTVTYHGMQVKIWLDSQQSRPLVKCVTEK